MTNSRDRTLGDLLAKRDGTHAVVNVNTRIRLSRLTKLRLAIVLTVLGAIQVCLQVLILSQWSKSLCDYFGKFRHL